MNNFPGKDSGQAGSDGISLYRLCPPIKMAGAAFPPFFSFFSRKSQGKNHYQQPPGFPQHSFATFRFCGSILPA